MVTLVETSYEETSLDFSVETFCGDFYAVSTGDFSKDFCEEHCSVFCGDQQENFQVNLCKDLYEDFFGRFYESLCEKYEVTSANTWKASAGRFWRTWKAHLPGGLMITSPRSS